MSAEDEVNNDNTPYRVGYSKPPKKNQFKKGSSGNPNGRPRKARQVRAPSSRLLGSDEPTTEMILELGLRPVRVREGGSAIEMPVNEAIIIAMQQNALKGNRTAQRDYIMLLRTIERDRRETAFEHFKQLTEYKLEAKREIERCEKLGIAPPIIIPHPDDIEIDPRNGTALVNGPVTPEEKRGLDLAIERRDQAAFNVDRAAQRYKQLRDPGRQNIVMQEWIREQKVFDQINDPLPSRYKKTLAKCVNSEASENSAEPSLRRSKRGKII